MADEFTPAPIEQPKVVNSAPEQTQEFSSAPQAAPMVPEEAPNQTGGMVHVLSPEGELGHIPVEQLPVALEQGYTQAPPEAVAHAQTLEKHGSTGEQVKAGLEGAGKGLLGPAMTGLEVAAGVKPEDIRGREEANPVTHGLAEAGTFLGSLATGEGEAKLLGEAGAALEGAMALKRATRIQQIGTDAVRGAFEAALYQGGEEIHKGFTQDPNQSAESAIANIGMSALLGGSFGAALGAISKPGGDFVSQLDLPAVEAGNLEANLKIMDMPQATKTSALDAIKLNKQKVNAGEITAAAKELGAPVVDGMTLESPVIQTSLDALIHSPYSVSGNAVRNNFDKAYSAADGALQQAIKAGEGAGSKAELGESIKNSITGKIREQYQPIKDVYEKLAETHSIIPIEGDLSAQLSKDLRNIDEFRVSPSSPQGALVKQIFQDINNVKTVSDLKILKDGLSLPATASSQERRMVGILRDKLGEIEESAIEKYVKGFAKNDEAGGYIKQLIDMKKAVTPQYKEFISKVGTLSEQLGKGKVHGVEDALRFLNERLTPEEVATKLFTKKDSEFTGFFRKNFPEEFQQIRNYQRAELIEKASKTGEFSPKVFFNNLNKLEPETQKALYTAQELKKVGAAETYIREAFPKNFNPSGTAHTLALREAFHPKGLILANLRDTGMAKMIELASRSSEGQQAVALAKATVSGERLADRAVKNIFKIGGEMPSSIVPAIANRAKLDKLVQSYVTDPFKMVAMNDNNHSVPEYNTAFAATASRVVQYLASLKPDTKPKNPLDRERPANAFEKSAYNRAMDIAEQPLVVLKAIKDGRITPKDIVALRTMYPSLYNNLSKKMLDNVTNSVHKGEIIPYGTRMGLSLFLGQPLDSTMTPSAIMAAQGANQASNQKREAQEQPQRAPSAASMKGLSKLPATAQTPGQQREAARATGKH